MGKKAHAKATITNSPHGAIPNTVLTIGLEALEASQPRQNMAATCTSIYTLSVPDTIPTPPTAQSGSRPKNPGANNYAVSGSGNRTPKENPLIPRNLYTSDWAFSARLSRLKARMLKHRPQSGPQGQGTQKSPTPTTHIQWEHGRSRAPTHRIRFFYAFTAPGSGKS